jgi:hypothetical protein
VSDTDHALAVPDHDECRELEATAALDDLGHTVDGYDALVVLVARLGGAATSATVVTTTTATATATAA